jgi:hypothetical protein
VSRLDELTERLRAARVQVCRRCKRTLPLARYANGPSGAPRLTCRDCCNEVIAQRRERDTALLVAEQRKLTTKRCNRCLRMLPLSAYHACTRSEDGRQPRCKECSAAYQRTQGAESAYRGVEVGAIHRPHRICSTCCDQAHRVVGRKCRECGLAYAPLPDLHVEDFAGLASSAGELVAEAIGNTGLANGLGRRGARRGAYEEKPRRDKK